MNNPQWSTWWTDLRGMAVSAMPRIHKEKPFAVLRARAEINSHFGASAGRADARRRDEGDVGHRRGAATKPIRALAAAPLRAAARRLAGFVARSSHTAPGIARRSRLASGPGGLPQHVNLFLRQP